jgi:hypothetical protein
LSDLKPSGANDDLFGGHMTKSSKLTLIAATLVVGTLTSASAQAQKWRSAGRVQPPPQGTGRLRNAAQGMCLDVAGWAAQGNASVLLWECNDDPDHVWSFTSDGELHNSMNGACLDAAGYRGEQGADVDVFRCEALDDQHWKLVPRGQKTFELRNGKRGLCLDVDGRAGARGNKVLLWACDGGADQLWSFEPYAPRPTYQPAHAVAEPPRPMEEARFRALVASVRDASFSDSQLTVIQQALTRNYLRVGQIKNLIDLVAFSATKLRVLELGAPRIVDPENAFTVYDAFAFGADKAQARQILRRNGL